jgi:Protein of unknown function (DUF2891)
VVRRRLRLPGRLGTVRRRFPLSRAGRGGVDGTALDRDAFPAWLGRFLPGLAASEPAALFVPATVTDSTDGQIAHLHGLNLSRAWAWRRLAEALPEADGRREPMMSAARRHAQSALDQATGSDYMVEHWLAAYALLCLSDA